MSWTNNITNVIVDNLPAEVEYEGQMVPSSSLTVAELKSIGWYELKPLVMGNEIINPQWQ